MKIKLDENLPTALVAILDQLGHETDTVASEGLAGLDDQVIWEAAQIEQRFLITRFGLLRYPALHSGDALWYFTCPFTSTWARSFD
ncbi:MAG: hypothetical protein ALAOOOJD_03792 [bacterium]|nr:hypothetical protein [bacterium]